MKQLIFFALAVLTFAASILYSSQFLDIKPLIIMLSFGMLITSFLYRAGLNKRDFDERKYKRLLREKNNLIQIFRILNANLSEELKMETKKRTGEIISNDGGITWVSPDDITLPQDLRL